MLEFMIYAVIWWLSGVVGWWIGKGKGRDTAGFWLGFFAGPIGWVVAALLQPSIEHEAARRREIERRMRRQV